ncbi:hypothetical protein Pint_01788 [Pistacia integerrima]|uniref:Uncharacterized protein n=1 Tax=Pistacia integerrima TaxID=434235 RepID=A0ACC0ZLD8_9ROSI|nr:hypothetical protein Pint_01788 [Pistacia integerrima]
MKVFSKSVPVCVLLVAYIVLTMTSWPLQTEAKIPEFAAIQGSLIRRSLRPVPVTLSSPSKNGLRQQFAPSSPGLK